MEQQIEKLPFTDQPTKQMLQSLVERKRKHETYKQKLIFFQLLTVTEAVLFLTCFYLIVHTKNGADPSLFLFYFFQPGNVPAVLLLGGSFATCLFLKRKEEKAEKEFHELRCEIIDKSTDLWKNPVEWQHRDKVFAIMKKEYHINLYYKAK